MPGYDGSYEISSLGRVSGRRGIMRLRAHPRSGLRVDLYRDGRSTTHWAHRLVAAAFLGEGSVIHVDRDPSNNALSNLRLAVPGEPRKGRALTWDQVRQMRERFEYGWNAAHLGRVYGVSQQTAWSIVHGHTWRQA